MTILDLLNSPGTAAAATALGSALSAALTHRRTRAVYLRGIVAAAVREGLAPVEARVAELEHTALRAPPHVVRPLVALARPEGAK